MATDSEFRATLDKIRADINGIWPEGGVCPVCGHESMSPVIRLNTDGYVREYGIQCVRLDCAGYEKVFKLK